MADLDKMIKDYDIQIHSDYIPMTGHEEPRLKWKVRLRRLNESVLEVDYTAGIAHAPSYPACIYLDECRIGRSAKDGKPIKPDARDVVRSVMLDCHVLEFGCFEDWARDYGYDTDSRAAEAVYRLCLQRAVMLRANLGKEKFDALQLAALTED
jgi:hypothetical protein